LVTLTSRHAHILRVAFKLGRPNVNDLVRNQESPTRLKVNLKQLVEKRYLHMDRQGNQHRFTITNTGLRHLAKYDGEAASASIGSLAENPKITPREVQDLRDKLAQLEHDMQMIKEASRLPGLKVTSPATQREIR
jgi:hypothetical protein